MPKPSHSAPDQKRSGLFLPDVLPIAYDQPLHWLALGFKDMAHAPLLSMFHGLVLALLGGLITWIAHDKFWLLAGFISGFLVVAPVLATSLYAMSRAIERGESVNFQLLVRTWMQWPSGSTMPAGRAKGLIQFGLLLALASAGWVMTSSALITLLAPVPIHTPMEFIRYVVLSNDAFLFEWWLGLGGLMAAPVFASSVVSIPLLLDQQVSVLQAVLTSWKTVLTHPLPMAFWAFLIIGFSLLGVFSLFLGLILIVPVLGHGSWHAYRELIDASGLEKHLSAESTA